MVMALAGNKADLLDARKVAVEASVFIVSNELISFGFPTNVVSSIFSMQF